MNLLKRLFALSLLWCLLGNSLALATEPESIVLKRYVMMMEDPNDPNNPDIEYLVYEDQVTFNWMFSGFAESTVTATEAWEVRPNPISKGDSTRAFYYLITAETFVVTEPAGTGIELTRPLDDSNEPEPEPPGPDDGDPDGDGNPGPNLPNHPVADPDSSFNWEFEMGDPQMPPSDPTEMDESVSSDDETNCGMAVYRPNLALASVRLSDKPLSYRAPFGPQPVIRLTYNDNGSLQSTVSGSGWLGLRWSLNWLQYLIPARLEQPPPPPPPTDGGMVHLPPAVRGAEFKLVSGSGGGGFAMQYNSLGGSIPIPGRDIWTGRNRPSRSDTSFDAADFSRIKRVLPDGSAEIYRPLLPPPPTTPSDAFWTWMENCPWVLAEVHDRAGLVTTLTWDGLRLKKITDAAGGETRIEYVTEAGTGPNRYRIARVIDPRGRVASFTYYGTGMLHSITDAVGVVSTFIYVNGMVQTLRTPLGDTKFSRTVENWMDAHGNWRQLWRQLEVEDTEGNKQRIKLDETNENERHTLWWNVRAMQEAAGGTPAMADATRLDWRGDSGAVLAKVKPAGQAAVTMGYAGFGSETTLAATGTTLDDNTVRTEGFTWNAKGQPLTITDGSGRVTTFTYHDYTGENPNDHRDVHTVTQTAGGVTKTLATLAGYIGGQPQTITDEGGATTTVGYNARGQVETVNHADGLATLIAYRTQAQSGYGRPATITRRAAVQAGVATPADLVTIYSYDAAGRVSQAIYPDGTDLDHTYDAVPRPDLDTDPNDGVVPAGSLDRLVKVTYPDGTNERIEFDDLWVSASYDRLGRKTEYTHDALGRLLSVKDPAGRTVTFAPSSCCGGSGGLDGLTDAKGNETLWLRDVAGRVIEKQIEGTTVAEYEYGVNTGWLTAETDAKGNRKEYRYTPDGALTGIDYAVAAGAGAAATAATGDVDFGYDAWGRRETMSDATGLTTWAYHASGSGAGQVSEVNKRAEAGAAPFERLRYGYDAVGRLAWRKVGVAEAQESYGYDGFGRLKTAANPLGAVAGSTTVTPFAWTYGGPGGALSEVLAPNGVKTVLGYGTVAQDRRLASILHQTTAGGTTATFSSFFYQWDEAGRLTQWDQTHLPTGGVLQKRTGIYGYNKSDELTGAVIKNLSGAVIESAVWAYDDAGNRIHEQEGTTLVNWTANEFNQLGTGTAGGPIELRGTVTKGATVKVNGQVAQKDGWNWSKTVNATVGMNSVTVEAIEPTPPPPVEPESDWRWLLDPSDPNYVPMPEDWPPPVVYPPPAQTAWGTVTFTVAATPAKTLSYDANGNMLSDGELSYEWDAENRLVAIEGPWGRSEFTYDGSWRRVRLVEKDTSGNVTVERRFGWEGLGLVEERDASEAVVKRFWGVGEERIAEGLLLTYTRDHLGSIREVVDATGTIRARYAYEEWGKRTKLEGDLDSDFGFTGHFEHGRSGVTFAPYRGYRSDIARWLSPDPIGEAGGLNLYGYVGNAPGMVIDPLGLDAVFTFSNGTTRRTQNAAEFKQIARSAKPGSIERLDIDGHGSSRRQGFNPDQENDRNGIQNNDGEITLYDDKGRPIDDVGKALAGKFSESGTINLQGCEVSAGNENLARSMSSAIPNVPVTGNPARVSPNKNNLIDNYNRWHDKKFGPRDKTYINGQLKQ